MKKSRLLFVVPAILAFVLTGCDNQDYSEKSPFDNAVYLDAAAEVESVPLSFNKKVTDRDRKLMAVLAFPAQTDITATLAVGTELVAVYNRQHNTAYELLDASHYTLSATELLIPATLTASDPTTVHFSELDQLPVDVVYLLPITISQAPGISILPGSRTVYYLVRRSSAITTAANLGLDNFMNIPGFDTAKGCVWVNQMKAVTYEAIIRINSFKKPTSISSIMGVEMHCNLRIGDTGFTREQLQVEISGANKFPGDNRNKRLKEGEWYHIAFTWDLATKEVRLYVNGKLQSEGKTGYSGKTIDLGMRGLFATDPVTYPSLNGARQFFIGYSYDKERPLNGLISEVRVWNTVRTPEQIWKYMYDVEPTTEGLCAYWKFNEGEGNVVVDQTGHGNDAVSNIDLKWDNTIEIPQLNAE